MRKLDEAYEFIKSYIMEKDYPPTIREIGDAINISSTSTISYYLRKLEAEHKIIRSNYKNRSIQLVENVADKLNNSEIISLPLISNLTMGKPLKYEPNIKNKYIFSGSMFKGYDMFLIPVKDDKMASHAILKGDMVVVSRQNVARNGEIVVAIVDDDYIIARLSMEFGVLKLSYNENAEPIYAKKVVLLGRVVGVIRNEII